MTGGSSEHTSILLSSRPGGVAAALCSSRMPVAAVVMGETEIHTPRVWWLSLCRQTGTVVLAVLLTLLGRGMRFENTNTPPLLFSDSV